MSHCCIVSQRCCCMVKCSYNNTTYLTERNKEKPYHLTATRTLMLTKCCCWLCMTILIPSNNIFRESPYPSQQDWYACSQYLSRSCDQHFNFSRWFHKITARLTLHKSINKCFNFIMHFSASQVKLCIHTKIMPFRIHWATAAVAAQMQHILNRQ